MAQRKPARRKKQGGRASRFFKVVLFFLILPVLVGVAGGWAVAFSRAVPSVAELKQEMDLPSTRVYADDDALIGEIKVLKGRHVPLKKMPDDLINAVVAVEDANFWKHEGVDLTAILRAAIKDIITGGLREGGSTITQQLAKIAFLTPEKTFERKLRELVLARRLEKELDKEEILELYLNRAYLGHGAYGVEMAAQVYFDKPVGELTLPEAALIAGLLKAPTTYSPFNNFERARSRQVHVLGRMEEVGYITKKERADAERSVVVLKRGGRQDESVNYFIDYVRQQLVQDFGEEAVYRDGLKVYTTLDRRAQAAAHRALQRGLRELDKRRGWRGPVAHKDPAQEEGRGKSSFKRVPPRVGDVLTGTVLKVSNTEATVRADSMEGTLPVRNAAWAVKVLDPKTGKSRAVEGFTMKKVLQPGDVVRVAVSAASGGRVEFSLEQDPEAQGAVVAMDPSSGFVRAMVGGYDYRTAEFNRAVLAKRQAGSAFKPIVYASALQGGLTPATVLEDEAITYGSNPEEVWTPKNYDGKFMGPIRLRDALAYSRNVVTIKVVEEIGIDRVISFARSMGIKSEMPRDLTLSLGSLSISPLELTSAYSAFANNGVLVTPVSIKYVTDRRGKVIKTNSATEAAVIDPQTAYLITSMMRDVVNYGTGWRARSLGRPVAGKTGTTNEYRDAWFVGYSPDLLAGVWVGFDDMRPLGHRETGSTAATPVWVYFMGEALGAYEPRDFQMPEGIVSRLIDPATGLLASKWTSGAVTEYFREGTEPREYATSPWHIHEPASPLF